MAAPPQSDMFRTYARLHAVYQLCRFTSPPQPPIFIGMQAPFVLAALLFPSKAALAASALANVLTIFIHIPAVVDMDHWSLHTDVGLLALMAAGAGAGTVSSTIRAQMAVFYAAAGLWKATVDHSDPQLSCSSLMLVQILCGWLPAAVLDRAPSLVALVAQTAPHVTFVAESGIPLLLLAPSRLAHTMGVLLAIALHIGITVAPLPLSISDFGALASSRLSWILPTGATLAVAEVEALVQGGGGGSQMVMKVSLAVAAAASAVVCAVHGSTERLVAHTTFCGLVALLGRGLVLELSHAPGKATGRDADDASRGRPPPRVLPAAIVAAAAFYAFGMPMLGLIDVGACTMFSHIKLHGGSSHYFLPTGLVQRRLFDASPTDPSLGPLADFAGGEVRVEASSSAYLNGLYPGEVVAIEPEPLVRERLREVGHVGRLFTHPGVRERNLRGKNFEVGGGLTKLGLGLVFKQRPNGFNGSAFIRYTLPALELRMMLEAMRAERVAALEGEFTLEYTRIRGPPPADHAAAEAWRASGCGVRVTLEEQPGKRRTCYAIDTCEPKAARLPCAADELSMIETPPGWLARKMVLSNPYPILEPPGRYCGSSG